MFILHCMKKNQLGRVLKIKSIMVLLILKR